MTEEEISRILIEHVEKIFARREQSSTSSLNPNDTRTVKEGNLITIVPLDGGRKRQYRLDDKLKKNFPDKFNELIGKRINSTVTLRDGKYKITDIK